MNVFTKSLALMSVLMFTSCAGTNTNMPTISNDTPKMVVSAEPEAAPASFDQKDSNSEEQPNLPAGHPAIGTQPSNDGQPKLPAGHPAIPNQGGNIAGGAPEQGMPQLPAGHPDISKLGGAAATQPALGTLAIRAVQGTAGGPAIGAEPLVVQMFYANKEVGKLEANLDQDGTTTIENIPTGPGYQIVARVTHGGADFTAVGEANSPNNQLSIPVFETTDQRPAWTVQMRHILAEPAEDGLHVVDVIALNNPADRAWLGDASGAEGKRTTFALELPAGASHVELMSGFHECCTKVENGRIVNAMALVPGVTQYRFAYVLPIIAGKVELTASTPAPVKAMMVLMPEGTNATADGLEGPQSVNMGNGNTTYFHASDLPANKTIKVSVTNIEPRKAAKRAGTLTSGGSSSASSSSSGTIAFDSLAAVKAAGGASVILIVLMGGAFIFMKSPRNVRSEPGRR